MEFEEILSGAQGGEAGLCTGKTYWLSNLHAGYEAGAAAAAYGGCALLQSAAEHHERGD